MSNFFEHLVGQKSCKGRSTLGTTARAKTSSLTARCHEKLGAAVRASHAGKTRLEATAVKIGVDDTIDEGSPEAIALLEALLPEALNLVVKSFDEAIQGRLLRLAGSIKADRTFCDQGMLLPVSQRGGMNPA